ncbi:hypothetical protein N9M73_02895 [Rhodobacteraceae bacterium]|nr:hypothetical protein [Paracoccaceae bacterium]
MSDVLCYLPQGQGFGFVPLTRFASILEQFDILVPVAEYGSIDQHCRNAKRDDAFVVVPHFIAGKDYMKANIEDGRPVEAHSLIALITEGAESSGKTVEWERLPGIFESIFPRSDALKLKIADI